MRTLDAWVDWAMARYGHLAPFWRLDRDALRGGFAGALLGAVCVGLLAALVGAVNRGLAGIVVGALSGVLAGLIIGGAMGGFWQALRPRRQAQATLSIEIDPPDGRVSPGGRLSGHVQVAAGNSFRTDGGTVYLLCRGAYTHDAVGAAGEAPTFERRLHEYLVQPLPIIAPGTLRADSTIRYPFAFTVPPTALPSHQGYGCAVHWSLYATLSAPGTALISAQRELLVEATPPAIDRAGRAYQTITPGTVCQLGLFLPRAVYAEGDTVAGQVQVIATDGFDAAELRVVLLRVENTRAGDDHTVYIDRWDPDTGRFQGERQPGGQGTTYIWLEDERRLGTALHFTVADTETLAFALKIPAEGRPTFGTPQGSVTWKIGALLARAGMEDQRAFHEIIVHTGAGALSEVLAPAPERDGAED